MKTLYFLVDYKNRFGTKRGAVPYRSGMDKAALSQYFLKHEVTIAYVDFADISFSDDHRGKIFLYTSSEDAGSHYKSYIEDVVFGLELAGARVVPGYKYLRAHNNKVFMEILRDQMKPASAHGIYSKHFGTVEDLKRRVNNLNPLSVIKPAEGAMSAGVGLSKSHEDLIAKAEAISKTIHLKSDIRDVLRWLRQKNYIRESLHRKKFVVQNFIPGLENDWKVLIFGRKFYVLHRKTRTDDFRASGSGKFSFHNDLPEGLLDFAREMFASLSVPHLSIDIGFDGKNFYLFEFQAVYFGSLTLERSPFYFIKDGSAWNKIESHSILEQEYTTSVLEHLSSKEGNDQ